MSAFIRKLFTSGVLKQLFFCVLTTHAASAIQAPQVTIQPAVKEGVSTPVRMATDQSGNFYVADPRGGGILKFDVLGRLVKPPSPIKTARPPLGIAVTSNGNLLVSQGGFVSVLDPNNSFNEIGRLGSGSGQFKLAGGITVDAVGNIFVTDSLDNTVQVFKPNFSFSFSFGGKGSATGKFSMPTGIAYEKSANLIAVADTLNGRIQFFDTSGTFKKSIGAYGSGPLKFSAPQGVAFEYATGNPQTLLRMYVVDSFQSNIQVIDPAGNGTFLTIIGKFGTANGDLQVPSDLIFDQLNSRLLVANGFGNVTVYGINGGTTPSFTDTIPPTLTLNPVPQFANTNTLTISGTVFDPVLFDNTSVIITTNTAATAGPVNRSGINWSSTITGLATGPNIITVTATDEVGNISAPQVKTVNFDPTTPFTTLTVDPLPSATNQQSIVVTGTTETGATVTFEGISATATVTGTTWSATIALADGANFFLVKAQVGSKNPTSIAVAINVVKSPPVLTVSLLPDGSFAAAPVLNISGTVVVDANFDKITVSVNGGVPQTVPVNDGIFSTAVILSSGVNTVSVIASDKAGNSTNPLDPVSSRTINFDPINPARPNITIGTLQSTSGTKLADGAATSASTVTITGTATAGSSVTVNGTPVSLAADNSWTANVDLNLGGLNTILVQATLGNNTTSAKITIIKDATKPDLAIISLPQDSPTNKPDISGSTTAVTVTATVTNPGNTLTTVPVIFNNGTFTLTPGFTVEGPYAITLTATDALGNASTVTRTAFFDITPPQITVLSENPIKLSITEGTFVIRDKNGPVNASPVIGVGIISLDLTNVSFDPATLDIHAVDFAGNSTRNGDMDGLAGKPDIADLVRAMRIAMGRDTATFSQLLRGDVVPLVNGVPAPDGVIDMGDVLALLRKLVGLINF